MNAPTTMTSPRAADSSVTVVPQPVGAVSFRLYAGSEDIPGMAAADNAHRAAAGALEPMDASILEHWLANLSNADPRSDCLIAARDGATVGYALVEWHDLVDGDRVYEQTVVVDPSVADLGVPGRLLDWARQRLTSVATTHVTDRRAWLSAWTFDADHALVGELRRRGYAEARWAAEMLRPDMDDLPDVPLIEGYQLRTPAEGERAAVFDMLLEAFADHWGEYVVDDHRIEEWVGDPRFRPDLVVVAWTADGRPAAATLNVLHQAPDGSVRGLVDGVATHPDHRRRGLARACLAEGLRRLRDAGATSSCLGVDIDNPNRALALYESSGFQVAVRSTVWRAPLRPGDRP